MNETALLINTALASGTTLALAALGLLINERAGVLNLGAEGMMLVAAVAGFAAALLTGSDTLGFIAAAAAGAALASVFGLLVIFLNTNQYATGLALSLFGYGFSAFVGVAMVGKSLSPREQVAIPVLSDLPFVGPALFSHHPMVYVAMGIAAAMAWFTARGRACCCAPSARTPNPRMPSATRCAPSAWPPCVPAARCAGWPGPTSRWSPRRCGWRASPPAAAGSRWH